MSGCYHVCGGVQGGREDAQAEEAAFEEPGGGGVHGAGSVGP